MPARILTIHTKYPKEMAVVGRLLVDYSELEIGLMHCVQVVRDDLDAVLKAMFRVRSETQRIEIADALGRHWYSALELETQFSMSIGAVKHCLRIRSQYAHCVWHEYDKRLCFVSLEELARQNAYVSDLGALTFNFLDLDLLNDQETYFRHTEDCLSFVNFEGRKKSGKLGTNPFTWPKPVSPPSLHKP